MKNKRKNIFNILFDAFFNLLFLTCVAVCVYSIIVQDYILLIPALLQLLSSGFIVFNFIKSYRNIKKPDHIVHLMVNGLETEKLYSKIHVGDEVLVYPGDEITYVGLVKRGIVFVDESSINGSTKMVKREQGDHIKNGSIVVSGNAVLEVETFELAKPKYVICSETEITKKMKLFNFMFGLASLSILVIMSMVGLLSNALDVAYIASIVTVMIPGLLNLVVNIYLFIQGQKMAKKKVDVKDLTALSELDDIDVLCLDKTGTMTTGEYEIFKVVPFNVNAITTSPSNVDNAFAQIVSNVIKTNHETTGYYNTLDRYFHYDVSRIVVDSSSLKKNGLYSVVTFKGNKTYAVGEIDNFDYSNEQSVINSASEYIGMGYRVLVVVECKNPIKNGLIDGKSTGIGLIILKEKNRESIAKLIKYFLENGKQVKVISGDESLYTNEVARTFGIDIKDNTISVDNISVEQLRASIKNMNVFSNVSFSQKAFIVDELRKNGHKVMYIGNGNNDTNALKRADLGVCVSNGTDSAKLCSQLVIDDEADFEELREMGKKQKRNIELAMLLNYSQIIATIFAAVVFIIAGLFDKTIVDPFTFKSVVMWLLFGVYLPTIFLLFDESNKFVTTNFYRSLVANVSLYVLGVTAIYVMLIIQSNHLGFIGIGSLETANSISLLVVMILSLAILFRGIGEVIAYRLITFIICLITPVVYIVLLMFNVDSLDSITGIATSHLTLGSYVPGAIAALIDIGLYIVVLDIIEAVKGENLNVSSKSRS